LRSVGRLGNSQGIVHLGYQAGKHLLSLSALSLEVFHDAPLSFGEDDVNGHRVFLSKPPAAPDGLVILLKAVRRKIGDMAALLKVEAPCADLWLCDQHPGSALGKVNQPGLLHVVAVGT
jgi:hypothetical protein